MKRESARILSEARKYGIPAQSYMMATLIAAGWTPSEAYPWAYPENLQWSAARNQSIRNDITEEQGFINAVEDIRSKLGPTKRNTAVNENNVNKQLSKDDIADILRRQIDALPDGDKAKTDAAIKYAELYAMKKEEQKDNEEEPVRVYLPLSCHICPWFNNNIKPNEE